MSTPWINVKGPRNVFGTSRDGEEFIERQCRKFQNILRRCDLECNTGEGSISRINDWYNHPDKKTDSESIRDTSKFIRMMLKDFPRLQITVGMSDE